MDYDGNQTFTDVPFCGSIGIHGFAQNLTLTTHMNQACFNTQEKIKEGTERGRECSRGRKKKREKRGQRKGDI